MTSKKSISCPSCGKNDTWKPENPFRPFCSERCKLLDLGAWADESRRIPAEKINPESQEDEGEDKER